MNNQIQENQNQVAENRVPFSALISSKAYQKTIANTLRDPDRAKRFCAAITSAVATNPELQVCEPPTILSCALLGESLNLSPSPQLGQYYLVPFKSKAKFDRAGNLIKPETTTATFVLGYKGYIQLALRSGYYKKLNVIAVKQGELLGWDPLDECYNMQVISDEATREKAPTTGYLAMFEYLNGFRKTIYWSRERMERHADKYSPGFSLEATGGRYPKVSFADYCAGNFPKQDAWKYSSFWYKDFDGMAFKTMLRQLISKWGIMSVDLQKAFEQDFEVPEAEEAQDYVTDQPLIQAPTQPQPDGPEDVSEEAPEELSLNDI